MKQLFLAVVPILLGACATVPSDVPAVPRVDFHQHLVSPAFAQIAKLPERDGRALLAELDEAGIQRAVVLSVGYSSADERKNLPGPDALTSAENDWTSRQVVASGGRLIGMCSVNPLRDAATAEIERCLTLPGMVGIKQHFGNSGVSLRNSDHLARMQQVFALAQRLRAPIQVHMRARGGTNYGAEDARLFLEGLLPVAPDIEVVIAHLGSAGPGYAQADEIMAVFADAARQNPHKIKRLFFDVATNVTPDTNADEAALIVSRLRAVGIDRILYGSDLSPPGGSIAAGWEAFRSRLPLTPAELRTIARNRPGYAR